jgi:hypothetical protein
VYYAFDLLELGVSLAYVRLEEADERKAQYLRESGAPDRVVPR